MMINFHLSELLRSSPTVPKITENEAPELIKPEERQKLRKQIADSMVREEWIPEAMHLVEQAKVESKSIQEEFLYEMKMLMHDHTLRSYQRQKRLTELVDKVQNYRMVDAENAEPIQLVANVNGASLMWARARFEHSAI
jgi:hypothetical protein